MEQVKVGTVRVTDLVTAKTEETRASVVASVVAGLQAAQLSEAEYLAVVAAIHALLAEAMGLPTVVVTATSVNRDWRLALEMPVALQKVASRTAQVVTPDPETVAETVEAMVRWASPALWEQLRAVVRGDGDAPEK